MAVAAIQRSWTEAVPVSPRLIGEACSACWIDVQGVCFPCRPHGHRTAARHIRRVHGDSYGPPDLWWIGGGDEWVRVAATGHLDSRRLSRAQQDSIVLIVVAAPDGLYRERLRAGLHWVLELPAATDLHYGDFTALSQPSGALW